MLICHLSTTITKFTKAFKKKRRLETYLELFSVLGYSNFFKFNFHSIRLQHTIENYLFSPSISRIKYKFHILNSQGGFKIPIFCVPRPIFPENNIFSIH